MIKFPLRRLAFSIFCTLSVGFACVSRAEDEKIPEIKTATGKTYRDVRVTKVTPTEISIIHESGAGRIPMKDLSDDLKIKFGYDPAKAEVHAKAVNEAERRMADGERKKATELALLKTAKPGVFIIDEETNEGLLVRSCSFETDTWNNNGISEAYNQSIMTGGGLIAISQCYGDSTYLLLGVPKNPKFVEKAFVGGLFVDAGTKLENGTRMKVFRFVGLPKKGETISALGSIR